MSREKYEDHYVEFLLGTLEDRLQQELEGHLETCAECRQSLSELEDTLHSLPLVLPQTPPPAHVKDRILEQVKSRTLETKIPSSAGSFWRTAAIAASIAAIVLGGLLIRLEQESQRKDSTIATLQRESEQLRGTNQGLNQRINQLTQPSLRYLNLAGLENYEEVAGSAFIDPDNTSASVFLHNLPSLEPNQYFQLWVIEEDEPPYPSNLFQTADVITALDVALPIEADRVIALAVTIEPAGGSPQPTGPMIAAGNL